MTHAAPQDRARLAPREDVARHVGGSLFDQGRIDGGAFERPVKDVDGLSVTRLRFLANDPAEDEAAIRIVMSSRRKLARTSVFAEINVGDILTVMNEVEIHGFVCEDPIPAEGDKLANPAHALIIGLPLKGEAIGSLRSELVGDLLAQKVRRTFPAVTTE